MVQPRIVHPNLQLTDITERFIQAAQQIPTGELIKDEGFTLFEAVGALEIGDPKMDSGALEDGDDDSDEFDFERPLLPEEVMWVVDELICREVSWHQGYPLSQTLFTSVHLDRILWPDPKRIEDAHFLRPGQARDPELVEEVLRAYCLGLIKCCDLVLAMVSSQHYYEEEDFATQTYNRELLRTFTMDDIVAVMRRARKDVGDAPHLSYKQDLLHRLDFRMGFLEALSQCGAGTLPTGPHLPSLLNNIKQSTSNGKPFPTAFSIKIQRRLASSVPPRPMVTSPSDLAFTYFTQLLNDIPAAFELLDITNANDLYTAIWTFMSTPTTPSIYIRSLVQFFLTLHDQMLGHTSLPNMIISDLRSLVLPSSPLLADLPSPSSIERPPPDPRFQIHRQISTFIDKLSIPFQNQFRTFSLNRSRVRRNLCHAAVEWDNIQAEAEEVDGYLQTLTHERPLPYSPTGSTSLSDTIYPGDDDDPTDEEADLAYAFPLSSYIYHYKLTHLRQLIQMGFELKIYAAQEFPHMYWYLSHICSLHMGHLERMSFFVGNAPRPAGVDGGVHAERSKGALRRMYREFAVCKAVDALAGGLWRVWVVVGRYEGGQTMDGKEKMAGEGKGKGKKVLQTYGRNELRYELRMRPFQHLSVPEPLSYAEMRGVSDLAQLNDKEVLEQAGRLALRSRKGWEEVLREGWRSDTQLNSERRAGGKQGQDERGVIAQEWKRNVKENMKAAIGTSIAVTGLLKAVESKSRFSVVISGVEDKERLARWWAVPKIVPAA